MKRKLLIDATKKEEVLNLLQTLHPVKTNEELIRIGSNGDGGYLLNNDLEGIEACISPGVYTESEFELDCLKRGMKVFMADKSVDRPNLNDDKYQYNFTKKHIGCMDNDEYMTLDSWIDTSDLADNSDLLLQMDIEGGEYASLICASPGLMKRFRIMVIEFHSLKNLWNPEFFNIAKNVFDKILQTHYCVHIHPNNCCGIKVRFGVNIPRIAEFTFIRKDRVQVSGYQQDFPNPLDRDNMNTPSIVLPKDWYRI